MLGRARNLTPESTPEHPILDPGIGVQGGLGSGSWGPGLGVSGGFPGFPLRTGSTLEGFPMLTRLRVPGPGDPVQGTLDRVQGTLDPGPGYPGQGTLDRVPRVPGDRSRDRSQGTLEPGSRGS